MDEQQQERFQRAVDKKNDEAELKGALGTAQAVDAGVSGVEDLPEQQDNLVRPGGAQDEMSIRDKNSQKGKVTADKWNQ